MAESPEGRWVACRSTESARDEIYVFKVGAETPLFDVAAARVDWPYDVTGDVKRFIVNTVEQSTSAPFTIVVNWTAALTK